MKFTRDSVARLELPDGKPDAIYFDETLPGFGVRLRGRSKRWVIQYRFGANQRRESLGDTRKVTLEDARRIARNRFAQVELGTDPAEDRAKARAAAAAAELTLSIAADRYIAAKKSSKRPPRPNTERALSWYFGTLWAPLGDVPVAAITRTMVAARLQELVQTSGAVSASRARANLSALYGWLMREGLAEANPVVATNNPAKGTTPRDRVLSDAEIALIWRACRDDDFGRITRLLILTGCRREEIGALQWGEVDRDTVTISSARTKNHRAHTLPLPPMALRLLPGPRANRQFVFGSHGPGFTAWAYSKISLDNRIAEAAGKPLAHWTLHDLRRSAATGMANIGIEPHIVEAVLNHVSGHRAGVAGIYNRSSYDKEKRAALAQWAGHIMGLVGEG
jgi:integrase